MATRTRKRTVAKAAVTTAKNLYREPVIKKVRIGSGTHPLITDETIDNYAIRRWGGVLVLQDKDGQSHTVGNISNWARQNHEKYGVTADTLQAGVSKAVQRGTSYKGISLKEIHKPNSIEICTTLPKAESTQLIASTSEVLKTKTRRSKPNHGSKILPLSSKSSA